SSMLFFFLLVLCLNPGKLFFYCTAVQGFRRRKLQTTASAPAAPAPKKPTLLEKVSVPATASGFTLGVSYTHQPRSSPWRSRSVRPAALVKRLRFFAALKVTVPTVCTSVEDVCFLCRFSSFFLADRMPFAPSSCWTRSQKSLSTTKTKCWR